MLNFDYTVQPGVMQHQRFAAQNLRPLVSVITPFYNSAQYFEQTRNCVLNQTFPYFEWIIIDDGSDDVAQVAYAQQMVHHDARVHFITKQNEGPAAARNFGVQHATTDFLCFLDADDLIEPTFLETLWLALQQNSDAAWSYADTVTFGVRNFLWKREFSSTQMKQENLLVVTALVRRSAFEAVEGFDVLGRYYNEDWHFWLKLLADGQHPVHIQQYLFWYRNMEQGAMAALNEDETLVEQNRQKIAEISAKVPDNVHAVVYNGGKSTMFTSPERWPAPARLPFAKEKTRILLLLPHMVMGGADQFNLDLVSRLDREKYEVTIVTTLAENNDWLQRFSVFVDDIFVLPYLMDADQWPAFAEYLMRSRGIDIIFNTNSYYSYYLLPWLHMLFPAVAVIDYIHMEEWYYRHGGFARPSGAMGAIIDKTYVCNEGTRQVMIDDFGRDPQSVQTVYIGVDEQKYDPAKADATEVYAALPKLLDKRPIVLFPCRICAQKRPFLMQQIAARLPDCWFVVVGDGPQLAELKNSVAEAKMKNVLFAGRRSNMLPWYRAASITLICSLKEGLSLTAYESLSMGTPVVTSDVGGQAELVNAQTGAVVPLLQSEADDEDSRDFCEEEIALYVDSIQHILANPAAYEKMCHDCRNRILNRFTVSQMVSIMRNEFDRLTEPCACADRERKMQAFAPLMPMFASYLDLFASFDALDQAYAWQHSALLQERARASAAQVRMNQLEQMRTWKLLCFYQKWANAGPIGALRRKWHAVNNAQQKKEERP